MRCASRIAATVMFRLDVTALPCAQHSLLVLPPGFESPVGASDVPTFWSQSPRGAALSPIDYCIQRRPGAYLSGRERGSPTARDACHDALARMSPALPPAFPGREHTLD